MKTCTNCGAQLSDSAKFCPDCGTKQEEKRKFCSECGNQLQPSSKFCPECGTPTDSVKVENNKNSNTITPTLQKNRKKLTGFEEIKEKGGIIVYDPESYPSIVDEILNEIYADYKKEIQSVGGILQEALKIFKSKDIEWEKFGEPAKNVVRYGYPDDEYDEGIYYYIHNKETLILKGEGNTFRILSEEDQQKADNFWILNADIRKLQDKIKNLVVFGDDTGIRARLFKDFEKLEVVHFYGYVTDVRREAFWNCPIKYLGLSEDIDAIVEDSFKGAKFKYLIFPVFTSLDDFEFQDHCFVDCKELKYVLISEYLYDYMDGDLEECFQGCDKLNTKNVWSIDEDLKIERLSEESEEDLEYDTEDMWEEQENVNDLSINKEENMDKLNFPGYSTLVLSGKGYIIEGVGDELIQYYAVFTSNLKVELNGEDVTDKVKTADKAQFLASKFMNDIYDGLFYYGDDEIELPKSIFLLPEGTKIDDIELIPINGDFRDWDKGGIVADFIFVDDEEHEAQSYLNNVKGLPELPAFEFEESKYDDNRDFYSNYYSEDNETSAYRIW